MDHRSPMPLARFRALLDAYGAQPERWPADEREAARALLGQSPEAQRWRDTSARLDTVLDLAPPEPASSALIERILAATPQQPSAATHRPAAARRASRLTRRSRAWRYVGRALPLAAAAALVLWLLREAPQPPEHTPVTLAEIGSYDTPTDVLLDLPSIEALDRVPTFGCTSTGLGCLDAGAPRPLSHSALDLETDA